MFIWKLLDLYLGKKVFRIGVSAIELEKLSSKT